MPVTHIPFSYSTPHASYFRNGLQGAESNIDVLVKSLAKMQTMLSGDGTLIAHFDEVVKRYQILDWVPNNAVNDDQRTAAMALYTQLTAVVNKLTGGGVGGMLSALFNNTR